MLNVYPHLKGRKAILDLRCSTTRQADTSIPQQEEIGRAFCNANGIAVNHTIKQEGVTATIPGARSDFAEILRRKREGEDFDLLVMTDVSRFSRAGAKHGMSIEYELETEGIEVVFATNPDHAQHVAEHHHISAAQRLPEEHRRRGDALRHRRHAGHRQHERGRRYHAEGDTR